MYLKTLEIKGFKSFADQNQAGIRARDNGHMGPNGSGRAIFGDAIRWVLGEQSIKSLRGARMKTLFLAVVRVEKPWEWRKWS